MNSSNVGIEQEEKKKARAMKISIHMPRLLAFLGFNIRQLYMIIANDMSEKSLRAGIDRLTDWFNEILKEGEGKWCQIWPRCISTSAFAEILVKYFSDMNLNKKDATTVSINPIRQLDSVVISDCDKTTAIDESRKDKHITLAKEQNDPNKAESEVDGKPTCKLQDDAKFFYKCRECKSIISKKNLCKHLLKVHEVKMNHWNMEPKSLLHFYDREPEVPSMPLPGQSEIAGKLTCILKDDAKTFYKCRHFKCQSMVGKKNLGKHLRKIHKLERNHLNSKALILFHYYGHKSEILSKQIADQSEKPLIMQNNSKQLYNCRFCEHASGSKTNRIRHEYKSHWFDRIVFNLVSKAIWIIDKKENGNYWN